MRTGSSPGGWPAGSLHCGCWSVVVVVVVVVPHRRSSLPLPCTIDNQPPDPQRVALPEWRHVISKGIVDALSASLLNFRAGLQRLRNCSRRGRGVEFLTDVVATAVVLVVAAVVGGLGRLHAEG